MLSCVDSQEAAAAAVHASAVALIELLTRQITGSSALSHSTYIWMLHRWFSGAVSNVWLHSCVVVTWQQLLLWAGRASASSLFSPSIHTPLSPVWPIGHVHGPRHGSYMATAATRGAMYTWRHVYRGSNGSYTVQFWLSEYWLERPIWCCI